MEISIETGQGEEEIITGMLFFIQFLQMTIGTLYVLSMIWKS